MRSSITIAFLHVASLVTARSFPSSAIRWTDCSKNVPDSDGTFNSSTVDLAHLPPNLHCGQLDVPMDYSKPFCDTNKITLGLAMVRPEKPKVALFFNPGGSDAGVIVAWEVALNLTNAFDGLEDLDLFVMDVRGTFSSNALNVSLEAFAGIGGPYPTNETEFEAMRNASAVVIQSWIDNSSPPGIIDHVGVTEVVQDYEMARRALGYEKINFLGGSQGGTRAARYAQAYPNRVGNFVTDGCAPHGVSIYDQTQDQVAAMNRLMLRLDAYCQNNSSCPFHSQGRGGVAKAFNQIIETAKETPYPIPSCANSTTCSPSLAALDIQGGMQGALLGTPDFPAITETMKNTLGGDASGFLSPPPTVEGFVAMPLLCPDYDYPRTYEYFKKSLDDGLKSDSSGIGLTQGWQIHISCLAWPFKTINSEPIITKQPMLMVAADFDGSAPAEFSILHWETASESVLILRHGEDHVSFPLVDQESTKLTKEFLNTGKLPSAQNTTQTTVYTPGMKVAPFPDPYAVPTGPEAGDVDTGAIVEIPF